MTVELLNEYESIYSEYVHLGQNLEKFLYHFQNLRTRETSFDEMASFTERFDKSDVHITEGFRDPSKFFGQSVHLQLNQNFEKLLYHFQNLRARETSFDEMTSFIERFDRSNVHNSDGFRDPSKFFGQSVYLYNILSEQDRADI